MNGHYIQVGKLYKTSKNLGDPEQSQVLLVSGDCCLVLRVFSYDSETSNYYRYLILANGEIGLLVTAYPEWLKEVREC